MATAWETRFAEYVKRVLGLRESSALEVLPDLMPVLPVYDPSLPEFLPHRGEARFAGGLQVAAVAGQTGRFHLFNDSTDRIVIIERLWVTAAVAGQYAQKTEATPTPPAGTAGLVVTQDKRSPSPGNAAGVLVGTATAAAWGGPSILAWDRAAGATLELEPDVVLGPGTGIFWHFSVANAAFWASAQWRERAPYSRAELSR